MAGRITLEFPLRSGVAPRRTRPEPESPMRILVIGDFRGRGERAAADESRLERRKPALIDVDNFDRVLERIAPRLELGGSEVALELAAVDDFHPDSLLRRLGLFKSLSEIRRRMQSPATFADATAEFRRRSQRRIEAPSGEGGAASDEADTDTLARLIGRGAAAALRTPARTPEEARVQLLIHDAVAPHIVPEAPPHQATYIAAVDAEIAEHMRAILQAPQFKALEALWRSVHWLVSNLETGEALKLYVLDASRAELEEDMRAAKSNPGASYLHRLLVEQARGMSGGEPWSLIVADCAFGLADADVELLGYLGTIASHAGAPLLAAAKSDFLGCASIAATPDPRHWTPPAADAAEGWNALRKSAIAPWIGLALPRVLLRRPYGKGSDALESVAFEELEPRRAHESYLWGSGAFACALLIGRAFSARGWDMEPGDELDLEDLPAHTYDEEGEKRLQPCAEVLLIDRAAQAVLDAGLMPLLSIKNQNTVRLMRFQSIASPAQALNGPWSFSQA